MPTIHCFKRLEATSGVTSGLYCRPSLRSVVERFFHFPSSSSDVPVIPTSSPLSPDGKHRRTSPSTASGNPPAPEERAIYKGEEVVDQLEIVDARSEDPDDCLKIQLWKYNPSYFARERRVDPVSLACTFKGNEDERIEMSVEELLEEL